MTLTDNEIRELRKALQGLAKTRTHSEDCWKWSDHRDCAITLLAAEVLRLRKENERLRTSRLLRSDAEGNISVVECEQCAALRKELEELRSEVDEVQP